MKYFAFGLTILFSAILCSANSDDAEITENSEVTENKKAAVGDANSAFDDWLDALMKEAQAKGYSRELLESALGQVEYVERAIRSDRSQPEFKESYQQYIEKRVSEWRISTGKRYLAEHHNAMREVSAHYGVPAEIIAAVIGVETNYGTYELTHNAFSALATLAYDPRRASRFRKEIYFALDILAKGEAEPSQMKSSWAGALGIPQFMPASYAKFAVDFDRDGKKDIWQQGPDLWASVANYLSHYGYTDKQAWARKVRVPSGEQDKFLKLKPSQSVPEVCQRYRKHFKAWQLLSDWNSQGIRRMNGQALPRVDIYASLLLTDPERSHGYLVYPNFCALMRYNPSTKYALSVGALADAIRE